MAVTTAFSTSRLVYGRSGYNKSGKKDDDDKKRLAFDRFGSKTDTSEDEGKKCLNFGRCDFNESIKNDGDDEQK